MIQLNPGAVPSWKNNMALLKMDDPLESHFVDTGTGADMKQIEMMTCRICLAENPGASISLFSLFEDRTVAQIMSYCTSLEVEPDDQLPKIICDTCFLKLQAAKELKNTSIISYNILRRSLTESSIINVKQESDFKATEFLDIKIEPVEILNMETYDVKDEDDEINQPVVPKNKKRNKISQEARIKRKYNGKNKIPMTIDKSLLHECIDCGRKYDNMAYFENHRCKVSRRTCSICNAKFEEKEEFLQHFKDSHFDHKKCHICDFEVRSAKALHFHLRTHQQKNSYMCEFCSKVFHKPYLLKYHRAAHTQHYQCDFCGIILVSRASMSIHMSGIHMKADSIKCVKCSTTFKRKISWQLHQIQVHGAPAPVSCSICLKGYMYVSQVNAHNKEAHLKVRPEDNYSSYKHKCDSCHKVFKHPSALYKHMKRHESAHTITKAGLKLLKYECTLCTKKFYRGPMLADHMRVHTGERPFQCTKCLMCFAISKTLRVHLKKIHHEINPYVSTKPNVVPGNMSKMPGTRP